MASTRAGVIAAAAFALMLTACSSGSPGGAKTGATTGPEATRASSGAATATSARASTRTSGSAAPRADPSVGPDAVARSDDWPTYHGDTTRTGVSHALDPVHGPVTQTQNVPVDGAVYASPIVADGATVVATENNTVYRISGSRVVWSRHLGAPVPRSELPCGNIDPSGITGTPAYDAATSTVVVVALLDHPIRHVAYGLDPLTGSERWHRVVDVTGESGVTPDAMQERGALLISGGHLYVPYGGLAGDCSTYRGSVVDLDLLHPVSGPLAHFTIPTSREAGIWAPPGASVSPLGGILVADGNGATAGTGAYDHSDSVLRLVHDKMLDSFSPSTWRADNAQDLDLGSQGPAVVGSWIFIAGKRGTAYVLDGRKLGGIGGQVSQRKLCASFGGTAVAGSTVYVPCQDGVRAVRINADGTMTVLWHAAATITGSPVLGGGRLWTLDPGQGVLHSLNPATGASVGQWNVGPVSRFATPALWHDSVLVGTLHGLVGLHWS